MERDINYWKQRLIAEEDEAVRLHEEIERLEEAFRRMLDKLKTLVDQQAEDKGLWFFARTAPEAYLQQELRKLHALCEECIEEAQDDKTDI